MNIDLKPFCSRHGDSRFRMVEPFNVNGWTYATNGRIAVRVQVTAPDSVAPEGEAYPPMDGLFKKIDGERVPWPVRRYCPQCFDVGTVGCDGCYGSGGGCGECNGGCYGCGKRRCRLCNGGQSSGQLSDGGGGKWCLDVGSHWIDVRYDDLIRDLPKVTFVPLVDATKPLPFFFHGGEGRLMGVSRT